MGKKSIQRTIETLEKKWSTERPRFEEPVIEADLLIDLFRAELDFDGKKKSATHQHLVRKGNGKVDILLRINPKTKVIVEVKQLGVLEPDINKGGWMDAVEQAARYVRDMKQEYGIVTDGLYWLYFSVRSCGNFRRVHRLIWFHVKTHRRLALEILDRSRKRTLKRLLDVLDVIHGDMTVERFDEWMSDGTQATVGHLMAKVRNKLGRARAADEKVIRAIYDRKTKPSELIPPLLEPLRLTAAGLSS
jgi:predicted type IV restriction endonuclease